MLGEQRPFSHDISPTLRSLAISGFAWALMATVIGHRVFGYRLWGGIILAPFIGLWIGRVFAPLRDSSRGIQIAGSLLSLYVAAICFALGMAFTQLLVGRGIKSVQAVLIEYVLAVAWGLSGYALVLWPLAYFNHRLFWQADAGQLSPAPRIFTTASAVRALAMKITLLALLGYAAVAIVHATLSAVTSSGSPMPWWVVTNLMHWSQWLVLGLILWLSAPLLAFCAKAAAGSEEGVTATYGELIGLVGFGVLAFPILSFAARLEVTAIKVSLVRSWATEGNVFFMANYYRNVFTADLPWFLASGAMICARRLIGGRPSSS